MQNNPSSDKPLRKGEKDRLQPALLDRLTDDSPDKRQELPDHGMMNYEALRKAVLRDLRWVLNTTSLEADHDLGGWPHVKNSTLNFGVGALAGKSMSEIDWANVEESVTASIMSFEPRILPDSLEVSCITEMNVLEHHNVLSLLIRGKLWCNPYPREFMFRTDIDLESGHMDLQEQQGDQ
ncbi:type VI secretion system baseplate subunit TssE [Advenella alkanexedens]|uniref:type VI secretion system baseplate subunit TssE n=1 Tax=Advenella alkanexedens TaxID=1481665 RepID=UPI002674DA18|nr:type VI secretion system baseplate subunit TssE [Advenella alkanexedens]WKU19519.1 type VI secretion system baseplate subunit TssE [Advenella alkanexedens]